MKRTEYLVVYEDDWKNKYALQNKNIGKAVKKLLEDFELELFDSLLDPEKMDNEAFAVAGGFVGIFYDIEVYRKDDEDAVGKIMIFEVEEF